MNRTILLKISLVLLAAVILASFNVYIDVVKQKKDVPVMQGTFRFFPDCNALVYKSNTGLKADYEVQFEQKL